MSAIGQKQTLISVVITDSMMEKLRMAALGLALSVFVILGLPSFFLTLSFPGENIVSWPMMLFFLGSFLMVVVAGWLVIGVFGARIIHSVVLRIVTGILLLASAFVLTFIVAFPAINGHTEFANFLVLTLPMTIFNGILFYMFIYPGQRNRAAI